MTNLTPLARIAPPNTASGKERVSPARSLSRRQKAAVIVRFLLNEGADLSFSDLPEDLQAGLTLQLGDMRVVDRSTLASVVAEFADELEQIGVTFPHDLAGALSVLDGRIHPRTAAKLRKQAGVRQYSDPWDRIRAMTAPTLLPIFEAEATEVAAVVLSKLDVARAAEVLALLPGDKARRITYAVSLTGAVTPDAVDRIGLSLASQLDARPERAFDADPEERIGAILNYSPSATREELLNGLDQEDAEFAGRVRKAIFTFANIPARIAPRDVPKIVRGVDQTVLVTALAAAPDSDLGEVAEFILSNMSARMADSLREEIGEMGKIKVKAGEDAMGEIVNEIRQLQSAGDIELLGEDEDAD
ncbi:flagellar motor switch protein FliG [Thalassovita taeanensis]|uniref:Flagellar motor switch protein FliG n=1 Tax=Thalassovita taeanensis TaxID=657014 RepID=A0A1H9HSR0_9RHOB|nr:FliG C-terminal domain-containing protein [Thalassovita taeanensis]SEQ65325.1 flagellar motor switch protein FliG [Thalassovita taeanensis]